MRQNAEIKTQQLFSEFQKLRQEFSEHSVIAGQRSDQHAALLRQLQTHHQKQADAEATVARLSLEVQQLKSALFDRESAEKLLVDQTSTLQKIVQEVEFENLQMQEEIVRLKRRCVVSQSFGVNFGIQVGASYFCKCSSEMQTESSICVDKIVQCDALCFNFKNAFSQTISSHVIDVLQIRPKTEYSEVGAQTAIVSSDTFTQTECEPEVDDRHSKSVVDNEVPLFSADFSEQRSQMLLDSCEKVDAIHKFYRKNLAMLQDSVVESLSAAVPESKGVLVQLNDKITQMCSKSSFDSSFSVNTKKEIFALASTETLRLKIDEWSLQVQEALKEPEKSVEDLHFKKLAKHTEELRKIYLLPGLLHQQDEALNESHKIFDALHKKFNEMESQILCISPTFSESSGSDCWKKLQMENVALKSEQIAVRRELSLGHRRSEDLKKIKEEIHHVVAKADCFLLETHSVENGASLLADTPIIALQNVIDSFIRKCRHQDSKLQKVRLEILALEASHLNDRQAALEIELRRAIQNGGSIFNSALCSFEIDIDLQEMRLRQNSTDSDGSTGSEEATALRVVSMRNLSQSQRKHQADFEKEEGISAASAGSPIEGRNAYCKQQRVTPEFAEDNYKSANNLLQKHHSEMSSTSPTDFKDGSAIHAPSQKLKAHLSVGEKLLVAGARGARALSTTKKIPRPLVTFAKESPADCCFSMLVRPPTELR